VAGAQLTIFENLPFLSCLNLNWKETAMRKSSYASQSVYSEPGPYRETLMGGGVEPKSIARWISSFMQHPRGTESEERGFKPEQAADLELRSVEEILSVAVKRNLLEGDCQQHKVGGVCRDFAIMAVSRFRESGIPARLRVGFADYLVAERWEDHWLCEWHDGGRWKRLDVEFAAIGGVSFDTLDVPDERFLTASEAWIRIEGDAEMASRFGVSSLNLGGEWFVAGSLLREMAALRKLELKPWDYWGLSKNLSPVSTELSQQARTELDDLASRLTTVTIDGEDEPDALADWPLPDEVISFPQGAQ
jgi:hypothetical protein